MIDGAMFDKFNKIGQHLRKKNDKPWGGMQIIVTGDFFQLPPVEKSHGNSPQVKFCFDADSWGMTIEMSVNLSKVFRQKDEREFRVSSHYIQRIDGSLVQVADGQASSIC